MENELKWEELTKTTQRLKVFGGWIVSRDFSRGHTWAGGASDAISLALVFIPDPNHQWLQDKPINQPSCQGKPTIIGTEVKNV